MTWYKVPMIEDTETGMKYPDTDIEEGFYASLIGAYFFLLTNATLAFPTLTNEEVTAAGIDPNRSISGA